MTWPRGRALGLACAAALLLGGCAVEGTLTIESARRVAVDLTVRDIDSPSCDDYSEAMELGIRVTPVEGPGLSCRFVGSLDPEALGGQIDFMVLEVGENLSVASNPLGVLAPADAESLAGLARFDLRVVFPGPVLRSSGTMSGNEASFTRDDLLEGGLTAVGQGHPGPPTWLPGLAGGLVAGTGIGAAIGWAVWRRRGRRPPEEGATATEGDEFADDPEDLHPTDPHPQDPKPPFPPEPRPAGDDSIWAPPDPASDTGVRTRPTGRDPGSAP